MSASISVPTYQKALVVQEKQGEWYIASREVPKPASDEVLVRVEATGLNPVDWKLQTYGFAPLEYPAVLGTDSAGVVVQMGEGVTKVKVGDRVLHQGGYFNRGATFQHYTTIHADLVGKIPSNLTFDQAASVPVALSAAAYGLYGDRVFQGGAALTAPWKEGGRGKYTGQAILIFGGASSVGQYVIQLAKLSGFSPIITTASPHNNDLLVSLGATHPIDRSLPLPDLPSTISSITSLPIPIVFDAVSSPETQQTGWNVMDEAGTLVAVLGDYVKDKGEGEVMKMVVPTLGSAHTPVNRKIAEEFYAHLETFLETGDIKPNQVEYVSGGLAGIPDALERMKKNQISGRKLVVRPPETA